MTMDTAETTVSRRSLATLIAGAGLAAGPAFAQPATRRGLAPAPAANNSGQLTAGDWLEQVTIQHRAIDARFLAVRQARGTPARATALKQLAILLTAHSIAEEVALYPGLAMNGNKPGSDKAYDEQSEAKVLLARLDNMPQKVGAEFDKVLTVLQTAITAHVKEEENTLFPALRRATTPAMNAKMTADFEASFTRYVG